MANFNVTVATDDGSATIENTLSWAIRQANQGGDDTDTITLETDVTLTGVMRALIDSNINIIGNGNTVDGDEDDDDAGFRPFFVRSGTVTLSNLTITDGIAEGGSSYSGGGGAGMGGGLFVYDGTVTLDGVTFSDNIARGGSIVADGDGGGGLFGDGTGRGGGGLFASSTGNDGAYGGDGNYGGSGGSGTNFGNAGNGGFGGGGGSSNAGNAGNGGFGGGGGFGFNFGGLGGFGGGGGYGRSGGGSGGYGGGGGRGLNSYGDGGYGGGSGTAFYGGAGAGMGGAVFIRSGTLNIFNSSFSNNLATGGTGTNSGSGLGGAIFAMQSTTNSNANNSGMPSNLPTVTASTVTFANNTAASAMGNTDPNGIGADQNNNDVFGTITASNLPTTPTVQFSAAVFSDSEAAGTTEVITLTRDSGEGVSEVQISITGGSTTGGGTDYTDTSFPLTVTFADTETTATIALPIIDDTDVEGDETITLEVTSVSNANIGPQSTTTFTITDDDAVVGTPGFTIDPLTLEISEADGTATFTVVLDTQPTDEVTLPLSVSDPALAEIDEASLTFNDANWDVPQTVTVTGIDNDTVDGDQTISIITGDPTSNDADYSGANANPEDVSVSVIDDDEAGTPGFTIDPLTLEISEADGTATFTVVLDTQPTDEVTLPLSVSDPALAEIDEASLTFNDANWDVPQTVTVTGIDNTTVAGDQTISIITGDPTSNDADYSGANANPEDVSVSVIDDDEAGTPGFTIDPLTLEISEADGTATFTVVLDTQPTDEVTLPLSVSDPALAEINEASLTFNDTNWDVPQTVTVTGIDNMTVDGDQTISIITGDPTSNDADYSGANANPEDVSVSVIDDDEAGTPGFTIDPLTLEISEADGTATFTVVLNTQPTDEVTLPLSVSDPALAEIDEVSLTFNDANWDVPQTVTVTGIDNTTVDGDQTISIITGDPTSNDADYNGANANPEDITVTVTDDDEDVVGTPGFTLDPIALEVSESGITDNFTVVLTGQPSSDVVLQVVSQDATVATALPIELTFTSDTWDQPQTVTVTGTDDEQVDGNQTGQITVSVVAGRSDDAFDELSPQSVSVTTIDDDVSPAIPSFDADLPTDTNPPTLSGTGDPGTTVEVLDGMTVLGTATVDGAGNWSFTPDDPLAEGNYSITLRALDAAGNSSGLSDPLVFTIEDSPVENLSPSDDNYVGTDDRNSVFAGAGNDFVQGLGGNDRLAGEAGDDRLFGGDDDDRLLGGSGSDTVVGGAGNDRALGGSGGDRLVGNAGNDRLVGGDGNDNLLGGSDDDTLIGGAGNDRLLGAGGNDLMRGNLGNDTLNGGAGNDRQFGGAGNDRLNGQGGNDVMRGGAGRDVLRGGGGNDRLAGELGNDLIVTGAGRDRIVIRSGQGFDRVTDFEDGQDRIVLGGLNFGQLSIQQRNGDVLISRGTERLLLLQNTNVGDISAADFA